MNRIPGVRRLLQTDPTRRSIERDVDEEVRFHLQSRIEDLMRQGKSRDDASTQASREFGDLSAARSELASIDRRTAHKGAWRERLGSFGQDIRFGLRGLRSRPAFAATVLLTLALGIGANAAIFSVVDAVLLRPLPYSRPDRLVHLWETYESKVDSRSEASYPDYLDWRTRNRVFSDLGGYHGAGFLYGATQPVTVPAAKATANFFDVLGVRPAVGRSFAPGDDAVDAPRVILIAYGFWRDQFAGDRNVIGRSVTIDGGPATIVGVLPRNFQFARQGAAQIWAPIDRNQRTREQRGNHWLNIVARLKDGVTVDAARADMSRIMRDLAKEYPPSNAGRDGQVIPLHEELVGTVRPVLLLLYGAVVVVLLIACVNVANLLLMRGADRQREIAVRVALGAGKARLVRQLLTESSLLAVCGGVLGLGVAQLGVRWLIGLIPPAQARTMPAVAGAGLDARVAVYAIVVSLAAGIAFGVVPAVRMTRSALSDSLKNAGRGSISGAGRLRDALVVGELALTVILMSGALLFGKSLVRLLAVDPGFRSEHVVTATVILPLRTYAEAQSQVDFFQRLTDRLREIPGVEAVGTTSKMPLDFGNSLSFDIVGQPPAAPGHDPGASYRQVNTDYFRALGIPLVRGRVFGAADDAKAPSVAVINRALATAYFGDRDPIGQLLNIFRDTTRIVGIVGDVPIGKLEDKIPPTLYLSFAKNPQYAMAVAVRTSADLAQITPSLRRAVSSIDPTAAMTPVSTMDAVITASPSVFMRRFPLFLVGAFALTALALAVVGIYGVVSYSVAQRTREMGIRMALGAQPRSLVGLVVRHAGWMAVAGIAVGVIGALLLGRFAAGLLYGIQPSDPLTYASVAVVLAAVAVGATVLPARRATQVDPALALRSE